ncbi:class I SAM-dependent methyltransferase [Candidatus Bathyarchaeota archaeon]|nr:class I SAM-dependent methyltransferase [Candidatus Bathyarchaeota archaeon]
MNNHFIAYDAYKKLAKRYAEIIDVKPHNAEYERPSFLSLIPDIKGKKVLDAGCGTGSLTEWLVDHGSEVIGVDASPHMLEEAMKRIKYKATLRLHDLREPLSFIEDESIDLVASSLVMHYLENIDYVFKEFNRIIKPGGYFIFSIEHPFSVFIDRPSDNYYNVEPVSFNWDGFTEVPVLVPSYRRPLESYTETLAKSGFCIERLIEPKPTLRFKEQLPDSYERHLINPLFMMIKAKKY